MSTSIIIRRADFKDESLFNGIVEMTGYGADPCQIDEIDLMVSQSNSKYYLEDGVEVGKMGIRKEPIEYLHGQEKI